MKRAISGKTKAAVVTVGDGRGFVAEVPFLTGGGEQRVVVTAAHCLPHLPPALSFSAAYEKAYARILGPLQGRPTV